MIKLYFEGDLFFEQLKKDIINAKDYIFIEFYIFQLEQVGKELLNLLIKKNKEEKVTVKILVDGVGSRDYIEEIKNQVLNTSIEIAVYKPFRFKFLFRSGYHRRNHRKLILIDDKIFYTGGMNIKDVMSKAIMGDIRWRDTMIRIENGYHLEIRRIFFQCKLDFIGLWRITKRGFYFLPKLIPILNALNKNQDYKVFSSINRKRRRLFRNFYYDFINKSKEYLYIATPYFVPPLKLIRLLKQKAKQGVDVRILTAGNTDVWLARQAGRSVYNTLLKSGIKIYEYQTRVFHAKQTFNEHGLIIGSSNIDYRSFLHNLEIDIFLSNEESLKNTLIQWEKDLKESQQSHLKDWLKRSFLEKITEKIAYGLRYYL
jgi:cardiolipin synthase